MSYEKSLENLLAATILRHSHWLAMDDKRKRGPTARSQKWKQQYNTQTKKRFRPSMSNHVTKRDMMGGRIPVPENPPDVDYQPWFHFTLVVAATTKLDLKIGGLNALFKKQLDPQGSAFIKQDDDKDGSFRVQYKLFSAKAWNLTGRVITLVVSDINDIGKTTEQLCGLVDTGSPAHTPCVGYLMPAAYRNEVLRCDATMREHPLVLIQGGNGDRILLQLRMAWRPDGPIIPVSIMDNSAVMINSLMNIQKNTKGIEAQNVLSVQIKNLVKEVSDLVKAIKNNQPSTASKIIDGVTHVASYVLPLVAETDSENFVDLRNDIVELQQAIASVSIDASNQIQSCLEETEPERIQ